MFMKMADGGNVKKIDSVKEVGKKRTEGRIVDGIKADKSSKRDYCRNS